jgi:hypothetical protein
MVKLSQHRTAPSRKLSAWLAIIMYGTALAVGLFPTSVTVAETSATHDAKGPLIAHAARTLNATDTAHLRYKEGSGSLLDEEGSATGTLPGRMRAHCNIGATFTASFTIYTRGGTINGHGTATPSGSGRYESFSGLLIVKDGTGRYTHAHGTAKLYGTFDRKTLAIVVQTVGKLSY